MKTFGGNTYDYGTLWISIRDVSEIDHSGIISVIIGTFEFAYILHYMDYWRGSCFALDERKMNLFSYCFINFTFHISICFY